jgi:hypothetical protein
MIFPAVRLHHLYSLHLYDGLDIIFEDLSMIDINVLETTIKERNVNRIEIVPHTLSIDIKEKAIIIHGNRVNSKTYMINKDRIGDIYMISYDCSNSCIYTGLEYLYHMAYARYSNLV